MIAGIAGCSGVPTITASVARAPLQTDGAIILNGRNLVPSTTYNVDISKRDGAPRKIGTVQADSAGNIDNAKLEYRCTSRIELPIAVELYLSRPGEGGATTDTVDKTCL